MPQLSNFDLSKPVKFQLSFVHRAKTEKRRGKNPFEVLIAPEGVRRVLLKRRKYLTNKRTFKMRIYFGFLVCIHFVFSFRSLTSERARLISKVRGKNFSAPMNRKCLCSASDKRNTSEHHNKHFFRYRSI